MDVSVPISGVLFSPRLLADQELAVALLRAHLRVAGLDRDTLRDPAHNIEVIDIVRKYLPFQDRMLEEEVI